MSINSRAKGARGERSLAKALRFYGYNDSRRTVQYAGKPTDGDADLVGLPGIHIEVKHVEALNVHKALAQAIHDAGNSGNKPTVFHKKNNTKWLVTMLLDDWIELYREWEAGETNNDNRINNIK